MNHKRWSKVCPRHRASWTVLFAILLFASPLPAFGQVCPSPPVANGTACTVAVGTIVTVTPANAAGLNASGTLGQITGNGMTVNLSAATTTGALAQSGSTIIFNGSTLATTSITTATSATQIGLRGTGAGSTITAAGSSITMGPPNGTTIASNMIGAIADSGGALSLNDTSIQMLGGATGLNNNGLVATGANSTASFVGGSISTRSRGSFGAWAQDGGVVTLNNLAQISTTGGATVGTLIGSHALYASGSNSVINATDVTVATSGGIANGVRADAGGTANLTNVQVTTTGAGQSTGGTPSLGSHGLYALGAGSQITGNTVTVNTAGNFSSAARAEAGGVISLTNSSLTSSGTSAADTDPASAARAMSGGSLQISGSTLTGTGQRGSGLSVQDVGSQASVSNSTVSAAGTRANAALIFNGGQATVTNSNLTSTGFGAVVVRDTGSSINLTNTTIKADTLATAIGYGLQVVSGASATMTGASVTTAGRDSPGLYAANATITATNVVVTTTGNDNALGVLADGNGQITLNGGSVTTTGDAVRQASFPHALGARNPGGVLTSTETTVLTTGITAMGAVADDGGLMLLSGNSITTQGFRSIGLYSITEQVGAQFAANLTATDVTLETFGQFAHGAAAQARNDVPAAKATLNVDVSTITTHGDGAIGLRATLGDYGTRPVTGRGEAVVIANQSTIVTEGIGAHGALSRDNPTSVTLNDTAVLTTGATAHGSVAEAGGLIVGNNASVSATGAGSSALFVVGDGGPVSTAIFTESVLSNASGPTIGVAGAGTVTLTNSVGGGSGEWLRVGTIDDFPLLATPELPLTGIPDPLDPDSPLPPPLAAFPSPVAPAFTPGLANVTLDGSVVTGSAFTATGSISNVSMMNDSVWNLTGNSNLTYLFNDPSLIDFSPPVGDPTLLSSYKTLTVVNYVGEGGQIALNTYLGADGSPSDIVVIDGGTARGDTTLIIRNTTGPGALTVANGILVVDTINGATSDATAFTLAGEFVTADGQQAVVGGAFAYTLQFGGVGADSTDNNWYLRSLLIPGPDPEPPFQPGDPVYEVYPRNLLALNGLPTMQQRVGNRYWAEPAQQEVFCKDASRNFRCPVTGEQAQYYAGGTNGKATIEDQAIWARIEGAHSHIEPALTTTGTDYDTNTWKLQAGFDGLLRETEDGSKLIGGITVHYGQAPSDVTSIFGNGGIDTTGYGFGGTLTWLGQNGFYVDGQASVTWFDSDLTSDTAGLNLVKGNNGFGYALSVETGKKIALDETWTITPQAQLVYSSVSFDRFTDVFGAEVSLDRADSLRGRLGISADRDRNWQDDQGKTRRSHVYGIANLYYEFLDATQIDVSGTGFQTRPERLWGGLGLGGSYNWNDDKYSVYGEVSLNTSLAAFADSYTVTSTAGFRVRW